MAASAEPVLDRVADRVMHASIVVEGVVQGVGFRPFVWRLATELGIVGRVRNVAGRVEIDAAGSPGALAAFRARLSADAPRQARVDRVTSSPTQAPRALATAFTIDDSAPGDAVERLFPPDLATCEPCMTEVRDPADRRYRYPFTNCTDCGPRATIIDDLPYGREATTMRAFPMCPECAAEYREPANRRFHAEPVACPVCGPRLAYRLSAESSPHSWADDALVAAAADLRAGQVVAVKGLGGYHLACDATNEVAVARLRDRKRRWAKPFAVMVADLAAVRRLARVSDVEGALLTGPARTYTPLHHLLLAETGRPLVLTSGNLADEPLAIGDDDAAARLAGVADAFLSHDREIRARYDDSVVRVVAGRQQVLRRGRGYAPQAIALPVHARVPVLAVGAELKHTFTLARGAHAHVAPHNGDLEDLLTHDAFTDGLAHLSKLLAIEPQVVAHDLHPEYLSTKYAVARFAADRRVAVQHHHAHVASCAAEHGITGPFLGVAYDGLGMGDDGTLWGGEVLVADLVSYRRVARFGRAPLPGGALAVRRPYRMALGYLLGAERLDDAEGSASLAVPEDLATTFLARLDPREVEVVRTQVRRGLNAPQASSAGRLFDAVAALLGLRDVAEYEAQAAVELERAAGELTAPALPYRLTRADGLLVYDARPTLAAVLDGTVAGRPQQELAAAFHETIVEVTRELLDGARAASGLGVVCLSGGVLQNRRLATALLGRLTADGFDVFINQQVPCNDGGISFGQAAVAAARTATGPGSSAPVTGPVEV
jgi:hydrogenase maturation protein HypF